MSRSSIAAFLIVPAVCGCDSSAVANGAPGKSATYYAQHHAEAMDVAGRCTVLNEEKQHTLSVGDYQEWQISQEWVNCQTALSVTEAAVVHDMVVKGAALDAKAAGSAAQERKERTVRGEQALAP